MGDWLLKGGKLIVSDSKREGGGFMKRKRNLSYMGGENLKPYEEEKG